MWLQATYGGAVYGSRMLTFQIGESCTFESNFATNCGGGMYLNIAGCSNPCDPGLSDDSIRYSSNAAGVTQGTSHFSNSSPFVHD